MGQNPSTGQDYCRNFSFPPIPSIWLAILVPVRLRGWSGGANACERQLPSCSGVPNCSGGCVDGREDWDVRCSFPLCRSLMLTVLRAHRSWSLSEPPLGSRMVVPAGSVFRGGSRGTASVQIRIARGKARFCQLADPASQCC